MTDPLCTTSRGGGDWGGGMQAIGWEDSEFKSDCNGKGFFFFHLKDKKLAVEVN